MSSRRVIVFLLVVLAIVAVFSFWQKQGGRSSFTVDSSPSPVAEEKKLTGTFVDSLVGQFVYWRDGALYQVDLPSRKTVQLAGLDKDVVRSFPAVRVAWSANGTDFAFLVDSKTLVVTEFVSGNMVAKITLDPPLDILKKTTVSFSPDTTVLLVKQQEDRDRSHIRFFSLPAGLLMGEQTSCGYTGIFIRKNSLYATACQIEGKSAVVTIDSHVKPLVVHPIGTPNTYTFLNEYDSSSLLVKKGEKPGKLTLSGVFTPLDEKMFKNLAPVDSFVDLPKAFAAKIMEVKKTDDIDDIDIAPSGSFAVFHTKKGLWIIDLPKLSDPYFLFEGSLPSVRP